MGVMYINACTCVGVRMWGGNCTVSACLYVSLCVLVEMVMGI